MASSATDPETRQRLLFISYAYEDEVFARWLARKLAFYGYGVWFDQIKILGGESWVEEVDVAIKEHSVRVLGILSEASISKPNPRKERTLALQLAKTRGISDFLVTLNLDGVEPDWTLADISWISFQESWANGLRRLLKKLDAIEAPRIHADNPAIARAALDRGNELVSDQAEEIVINWQEFTDLPETLRVYDTSELSKEEQKEWPCYTLSKGIVAALSPPPSQLASKVHQTPEAHHWPSVVRIRHSDTHTVIVKILNLTVAQWLREAGCEFSENAKTYYLPAKFRDESIFRYVDAEGTNRRIHTSGKITLKTPSAPPEPVIHHPAIKFRTRVMEDGSYVLQLTPVVALFDKDHEPFKGRKVAPRRKKVTRGWYNFHWRKRLMAFACLVRQAAQDDQMTPFAVDHPRRLAVDRSLVEAKLGQDVADDEILEQEIEVGLDELEDWKS